MDNAGRQSELRTEIESLQRTAEEIESSVNALMDRLAPLCADASARLTETATPEAPGTTTMIGGELRVINDKFRRSLSLIQDRFSILEI